jgi:hypothetical protein
MNLGRNKITPQFDQGHNLKKMVGRVLCSNTFPTFYGKLLYTENERCYFEMLPNPKFNKYNACAGQIEYLNEQIVLMSKFEDESI